MKKGAKSKVKVSKAIDSKEMLLAMEELEKENGMEPGSLMEAIETALVTAYKRDFDSTADNVKVVVDKETGDYHVYVEKEVVEEVEDDNIQISLEDAKKVNKTLKIGDTAQIEIMPKNFGRIAAGTAKQVIIQKIREASREYLFNEFSDRKGEIVSGLIQKADGGIVVVDLGRLEGVMPLKEQVPTESYHVNDKIRAYVLDVEKGAKGAPQVIISRAHADFVRKLFELEIPEIYELGGEKIDVIEWSEDPATFISAALLPAQVLAVDIKEEERFAQVIVPDDQLSLAIGKSGQNARLAAKLTNWKIDIKSESQFRQILAEKQNLENNDSEENEVVEALGDIIISLERVEQQAKEYGHSFERELAYMVVHGFYHLMGYDHMVDEDKIIMREKEENILKKLNINR